MHESVTASGLSHSPVTLTVCSTSVCACLIVFCLRENTCVGFSVCQLPRQTSCIDMKFNDHEQFFPHTAATFMPREGDPKSSRGWTASWKAPSTPPTTPFYWWKQHWIRVGITNDSRTIHTSGTGSASTAEIRARHTKAGCLMMGNCDDSCSGNRRKLCIQLIRSSQSPTLLLSKGRKNIDDVEIERNGRVQERWW